MYKRKSVRRFGVNRRRRITYKRKLNPINRGHAFVNNNMVYMKQLHRGPKSNYQLYGRHGNPSGLIFKNSPTGYNLRGSQNKQKVNKKKIRKNTFRSEL